MTELVEGSKDWKIAVMLVDQNPDKPDDHAYCGGGISCTGIACGECPYNSRDTSVPLGQLRKAVTASEPAIATSSNAQPDDGVRKPSHYQVFEGVESIEIIARSMTVSEFRGFCLGNVLKYRLRAGKKSELATMEKDLNKAAFYQELFELHKGKCHDSE